MVNQITFSARFSKMGETFKDLLTSELEEELLSIGNYAVSISPVWSGAFVNSWSIVPIGSGAGRSRTSSFEYEGDASRLKHPEKSDATTQKAKASAAIAGDVKAAAESILETGGAVLANRAPHAKVVEAKHATITRVRDRFR
jgi:hypothetical protein